MHTPDVSLRAWLAGQALAGFNVASTNLPDHVIASQVVSIADAVATELAKHDERAAEAQQVALGIRDELLDVGDLCRYLKVSTKGLHRLEKDDAFPKPVLLGGSPRWRKHLIDAYLGQLQPVSEGAAS